MDTVAKRRSSGTSTDDQLINAVVCDCSVAQSGGTALVGGLYNYVRDPALRRSSIKLQLIGSRHPVLLINCCLYARRVMRGGADADG
jgi:hypothetical protein